MKHAEIQNGNYYWDHVSGQRTIIKVLSSSFGKKFRCVNMMTGREIVRSARQIEKPCSLEVVELNRSKFKA